MTNRYLYGAGFVLLCAVLAVGTAAAFAPTFEMAHQHDVHEDQVVDVEYADYHDVVYSLDENGLFAAYDVGEAQFEFSWEFEDGHAIAASEDAVYIASGETFWEYSVSTAEFINHGTLDTHPEAMVYDDERDVVWIGGHETVHGYFATNGSAYMDYNVHSEGIGTLDIYEDYIVSGTTWETEVVVYDVENEDVVYEPDLPDDTQGVSAVNLLDTDALLVGALGDDANDLVAGYDVEEESLLLEHREHIFGVSFVGYEPHNDLIISTGFDNTIRFYDHETDSIVEEYEHDDTIYTASYDYPNSLLWIGDGEERDGVVSGIDIHYEADPADDDVPANDADPADDTADEADDAIDADDTADDADDTMDADDSADDSDDDGLPGFGPLAALIAIGSLLSYRLTRRRK